MASLRTGYGLPARPSDGYQPRKPDDPSTKGSIPRLVNRETKKELDIPKIWKHALVPPKTSSRAPQPSARRPSITQSSSKSNPDRQSRSWGSTSTATSIPSKTHAQTESGSSSSGRSHDDSLKSSHNTLRRKNPSLGRDKTGSRNDSNSTSSSSSSRLPKGSLDRPHGAKYDRGITESPAEIRTAETVGIARPVVQSPAMYPELDRYRDHDQTGQSAERATIVDVPFRLATHDLPPPTPASILFSGSSSQMSGFSGSPSTRLSESPGPGPYSRDTTPTSMSSQSPSFVAPSRINVPMWTRQNSPAATRPPVTRRRAGSTPNDVDAISADPHGLAAVRESLTSSSSNSTVRDGDKNAKRERREKSRLLPPPPSPPPRKSSQKFQRGREEKESPPKSATKRLPKSSKSVKQTKETPSAKTTLSPTGILKSPSQSSLLNLSPPRRPSRDGTTEIKSQLFSPLPIIQSNLSSASRLERRGSEPTVPSTLPKSTAALSQTKKNASTSNLPAGKEASSTSKASALAVDRKKSIESPRPIQAPSPKLSSAFNSKFPFFGRRKQSSDVTQVDKSSVKKSSARKGPAAGTGHEGYGRVGAAGRRNSSSPNFTRGSLDHFQDHSQDRFASSDPFLADRVNPVVIAGGEIIENRNASGELSRTESNLSIPYGRPSTDSRAASETSHTSSNAPRNTLWPSAIPRDRPASRRPSDSSDSEGPTMKSTIAFRRSIQRLRSSPDNPLRLPYPINTGGVASSPMTSFDTSVMSDESLIELQYEPAQVYSNPHPTPKKLKKRAPSPRKWNLFGRSQKTSDSEKRSEQVAATVQAVETRPVPFYAIMDSPEQEDGVPMDVQEVLRFADVYTHSPAAPSSPKDRFLKNPTPQVGQGTAISSAQSLPSTTQTQVAVQTAPTQGNYQPSGAILSSGRPSRLPQVGRIPHVVSKRSERPSPRSFSRPFRASLQLSIPEPSQYDAASIAKGPSPPRSSSPPLDLTMDKSTSGSENALKSSSETNRSEREFIAFSPRKYSDVTIGTSSSSGTGTGGTGAFSAATAIIPNPEDPPVEDEVWDEYNDLLGDDQLKIPQSATSSRGIPFHLETYHSKLGKEGEESVESPTIVSDSRQVSVLSRAPTHSTSYSADMTERIRLAFQPHPSPRSQPSALEGDVTKNSRPASLASLDMKIGRATQTLSRRSSSNKTRHSECSSTSSEDTSPLAQVNLRVGSMTVSKWLTFGHVLFSDIRHELISNKGSLNEQSILVIDGLGNDDWSFYAAETYPSANFFNLSPRAPLPTDLQNSSTSFPLSPPNHHQIQYMSHFDKFPYAPQTFTSVVYRFPVAAPESYYRNILSEARRVLKPGGFIELSILDVDLNNMGNQGRRTIRQLKERIHEQTPETSLGSTADLIIRLLGKTGFSSIKAAHVGVPVASPIVRSNNARTRDTSSGGKKRKKEQPSLAELMSDKGDMADESITKMVAKVGRWWYTRCYESSSGSGMSKSIWDDKALLSECEENGTSLKLMVCCARAPDRIPSF